MASTDDSTERLVNGAIRTTIAEEFGRVKRGIESGRTRGNISLAGV